MDKLVKHAIRMLEIVEGENDFFRNDAKRQADIARAVYDTILRVQALERKADRKTENSSEIPNNCEWSVEYAKEMLDTMPCEECGHWEHGAGDHYYCALLGMRQKCYFELKGESTLMFANKPKDEPTISKMEQVDEPQTERNDK